MGLFKRRPKIRVRLPRVVHAGTECVAEVTLDAPRPVPIEALNVRLIGIERAWWGNQARSLQHLSLGAQLSTRRELPRGETRFSCRFALRPDLPPTYDGFAASTAYSIEVHVDLSWWPDARGAFVVHVARPPPAVAADAEPRVYSSNPAGPKGTEPYVELSLADRTVASNGAIVGAIALGNVAHNQYSGVSLELVPVQTVHVTSAATEVRGDAHRAQLTLNDPAEGAAIPFRMKIPAVAPTDASRLWRLDWLLRARVERRFGRDLSVELPLVIVPEGSRTAPESSRAAPTLGSDRVERVWRGVARSLGFTLNGESMHAVDGETKLRVWREHLGRSGLRLFAELAFPSFELGLDAGPRSRLARLVSVEEPPGQTSWEQRHRLKSRDPEQARAFWRALFTPLLEQDLLGSIELASFSDERLRLELDDAGQNTAPLERLARAALLLARRVPAARAAIPAPLAMRDHEPAWRALARSLGAELETARMALSWQLDGQRAEIATIWQASGRARHTEITLCPDPELPIRWALEWSEAAGVTTGDLEQLSKAACERFVELERHARGVSIASDRLSAMLDAPLADPEPARAALLQLAALGDALRSRAGAYR